MIPKVIHYCWFGRNPLPKSAQRCIASWKKYLPDYEIKEWNEDNFDVNFIPYTQEAYQARKYAFVSDVARFWVLYHYGGVYFDTDVEVVRSFDEIVSKGAFMGWEKPDRQGVPSVAPGLCLGTEKDNTLFKEIVDAFGQLTLKNPDGTLHPYTMVPMVTDILVKKGLKRDGSLQEVEGVTVYPAEYFCPMDLVTGIVEKTKQTVSIHWYDSSWMNQNTISFKLHLLKNKMNRLFGKRFAKMINGLLWRKP